MEYVGTPTVSIVALASVELRGKSDSKGSNGPGDNVDGESFHMAGSRRIECQRFRHGKRLYRMVEFGDAEFSTL